MSATRCKTTWKHLCRHVATLRDHTGGAIAVEYGLIAALIAIAIIGVLRELGDTLVTLPMGSIIAALANVIS